MAVAGALLGTLLAAGKGRSRSFLRYVDEAAVDTSSMLGDPFDTGDEIG